MAVAGGGLRGRLGRLGCESPSKSECSILPIVRYYGPGLPIFPGPLGWQQKAGAPSRDPGIKSGGEYLVESVLLLYRLQISQQDLPGSYPLVCEVAVVA